MVDKMNSETSNFKQRACAKCGSINGGCKRWKFWFFYNRSAYVCAFCVETFGGSPAVVEWLEKNAIFSKPNGKLIGFKKLGQESAITPAPPPAKGVVE